MTSNLFTISSAQGSNSPLPPTGDLGQRRLNTTPVGDFDSTLRRNQHNMQIRIDKNGEITRSSRSDSSKETRENEKKNDTSQESYKFERTLPPAHPDNSLIPLKLQDDEAPNGVPFMPKLFDLPVNEKSFDILKMHDKVPSHEKSKSKEEKTSDRSRDKIEGDRDEASKRSGK
ncbi:MAG: hypothetical protein K2Z81_25175 [Cyanobacteria bacterium]|nr:hypothetical protein [Cyanobacteriota bacterium]